VWYAFTIVMKNGIIYKNGTSFNGLKYAFDAALNIAMHRKLAIAEIVIYPSS